jgi:hypothetical protein
MQQDPKLTLSELKQEWTEWRTNGRSRQTPLHLKEQALAQLKIHKASVVVKTLGLNSTMLKRWKQEKGANSTDLSTSFITLPAITPNIAESSQLTFPLKITHHVSDGSALSLEGRLSIAHWQAALTLLTSKEPQR